MPASLPVAALPRKEPFRPQFPFTPERNRINDPNGRVYHEGEYHLFFQYNPHGIGGANQSRRGSQLIPVPTASRINASPTATTAGGRSPTTRGTR